MRLLDILEKLDMLDKFVNLKISYFSKKSRREKKLDKPSYSLQEM